MRHYIFAVTLVCLFVGCSSSPPLAKEYFLVSGKQGYGNLLALCQKRGGVLAKIENAKDQEAAQKIAKGTRSNVVIDGMRSKADRRVFVNADGKRLQYTNWSPGEPNFIEEHCIMMYGYGSSGFGKWNDFYCHLHNTALCQKNTAPPVVPKEYFLVSGTQGYDNLLAECNNAGGILAKIENAKDQEAAQKIVKRITSDVVIDGRRSEANPKEFVNADGKRLPYTNWNTGEPDNLDEECIMMYGQGSQAFGKWNDFLCNELAINTALCVTDAETGTPGQ